MRRISFCLIAALTLAGSVFATQGKYPHKIGTDYGPRGGQTIQDIMDDAGSTRIKLVTDSGIWNISNDLSILETVHLDVPVKSTIAVPSGSVLTFNGGPFSAENTSVFTGSGIITGCYDVVVSVPEWFSSFTGTNYCTNCTTSIQSDDIDLTSIDFGTAISNNTIETQHIKDHTIQAVDLGTNSIAQYHLQDDVVGSNELADASVNSNHVQTYGLSLSNLNAIIQTGLAQVGEVRLWAGRGTAPTGWLICNGAEYNTNTYPVLWSVLVGGYTSSRYGDSDGLAGPLFNVPDIRGAFPRGDDTMGTTARGLDPDANDREADPDHPGGAVGSISGSFQHHALMTHDHGVWNTADQGIDELATYVASGTGTSYLPQKDTTDEGDSNESRPPNLTFFYIIKHDYL